MNSIPLSDIEDGPNVRTVALPASADEALAASIAAEGVLAPILVRPAPAAQGSNRARYQVVLGSRRVRAARAAGLTEIPAELRDMTDAQVRLAQMGDQALRRSLHHVDQWRAVRAIVETDGFPPAIAARALGLDERTVRRMDRVGRLPPTLLKLCEIEIPPDHILIRLLRADPKSAVAATKSLKGLVRQVAGEESVDWWTIVGRVHPVDRVSRNHAIFDVEASGLTWDEDLFAEPGSDDQFTTCDVERFCQLQRDALKAKHQRAKKHVIVEPNETGRQPAVPTGYRACWDSTPERPGPQEVTFWCVAADGRIASQVAIDLAARKEAEKTARKAEKVKPAGRAEEAVDGDPDDAAPTVADEGADEDPDNTDADTVAEKIEAATGVTKAGMALVHKAKTEALRSALREQDIDAHDLLLFFILAVGADNVRVSCPEAYPYVHRIGPSFVTPEGNSTTPPDGDIRKAARETLARMLRIGISQGSYDAYSGAPAEWIGAMIHANGYLARFDTAEFLAQCRGTELRGAAESGGVKWAGTGKAMRDRLAGQAENWRPAAATFGAAGPRPGSRE